VISIDSLPALCILLIFHFAITPFNSHLSTALLHNASGMHSQTIPAPIMRRNSSGLSPGKKYGAARAFYLTILIISAFTLWRCCVSGEGAQTFQADSGLRLRRNAISPSDGYSYQVEKHGPKAAHVSILQPARYCRLNSDLQSPVPPRTLR